MPAKKGAKGKKKLGKKSMKRTKGGLTISGNITGNLTGTPPPTTAEYLKIEGTQSVKY